MTTLLTNNFHQHPFASATIKLTIKNLFPGTEIESALGDGNDDFAPHDLPFHMGVGTMLILWSKR